MMTRWAFAGILLGVTGCGGGRAAETTPAPSTGARRLTAVDPDLSSIAKAAARSLQPGSDGKVRFGGVYVGGRNLTALSDTIIRALAAIRVDERDSGRVPFGVGREPDANARTDAVYTLWNFRVAGDRAFVGSSARSVAEPGGALCITLARAGGEWHVVETRTIRAPQSCGD